VGKHWARAFKPSHGEPPYVTVEDLARDTLTLVPHLPRDITRVVGSARGGLVPATLLSEMLHVPLTVVRNRLGDYIPASHGWRLLEGAPKHQGTTLVIDDTTMTGNSLLRIKQLLKTMPGAKLFAAVYVNPAAVNKPDLWVRDLPWPHLLEWNLFNSVLLDSFALDFDGIVCHDCPVADDDDGPRYERWMREVRPIHLVRKHPIRLVVTARLEKYRPQTLEWMQRWGVRAKKLVMGPWPTIADRRRVDIAAWKAEQLDRFLRKRGGIPPKMFIESDPQQAKRIAELTGGLVVCPAARRCFGKAKR
jgi:adenine/guanine phosphoribosyltransferase-like PRPP-binding protein